jgi:hypothetical protein
MHFSTHISDAKDYAQLATQTGNPRILAAVLKNIVLQLHNLEGLLYSITDVKMKQVLLNFHPDRTAPVKHILLDAMKTSNTADALLALSNGANPNVDSVYEEVVLEDMLARNAHGWCKYILPSLITHGMPVNTKLVKRPLIMWAIQHTCIETAEMLLAVGADVNATDERGQTALFSILRGKTPFVFEQKRVMQLLSDMFAAGADARHRDTVGNTPFHFMRLSSEMDFSVHWDTLQLILESLCRKGLDVNAVNMAGNTAFEVFIDTVVSWHMFPPQSFLISLVRLGVNLNRPFRDHSTLLASLKWPKDRLMSVRERGTRTFTEQLIQLGATLPWDLCAGEMAKYQGYAELHLRTLQSHLEAEWELFLDGRPSQKQLAKANWQASYDGKLMMEAPYHVVPVLLNEFEAKCAPSERGPIPRIRSLLRFISCSFEMSPFGQRAREELAEEDVGKYRRKDEEGEGNGMDPKTKRMRTEEENN